MNILRKPLVLHLFPALVCAILMACSEPEERLYWVSSDMDQFSDVETDWRYPAIVSRSDAQIQLSGGADADAFIFDETTKALRFVSEPDSASPEDADADGVYEVILVARLEDQQVELDLKIEVLPSGSGTPQLVFPTAGSNLASGTDQTEVTLVRAEPLYRGRRPLYVTINGTRMYSSDNGFWRLDIDYPAGESTFAIEAHYMNDIVIRSTATVNNTLVEPVITESPVALDTNAAHQFMPESGNLYFLENGLLQRLNVRTGELHQIPGDFHSNNRIVFGINSAEDSVRILDLGRPLTFPAQLTPDPDGRDITLSEYAIESGEEQGLPVQVQLDRDPIFSAFQFDPLSNTFLIDERMYTTAFYSESDTVPEIAFEKTVVDSDTGEVETINQEFSLDAREDIDNVPASSAFSSVSFDRVDMDWSSKYSVGQSCAFTNQGSAFVFDPELSTRWGYAVPLGFRSFFCESQGVAKISSGDLAYAAFYGYNSGHIVAINASRGFYRFLKPLWDSEGSANGETEENFILVHHISVDDHNQVLYISSTEFTIDDASNPTESEPKTIVRDRLWSYSLISGGESVISESAYDVQTPSPLGRIYSALTQRSLGFEGENN